MSVDGGSVVHRVLTYSAPFVAITAPPLAGQTLIGVEEDAYHHAADVMHMKSMHLDRKLSATAKIPKGSTKIENPTPSSDRPTFLQRLGGYVISRGYKRVFQPRVSRE